MNFKVWNKEDNINSSTATEYLNRYPFMKNKDIFLILDDGGIVEEVCVSDFIKKNYNLDYGLTVEQVAQEYIRIKEEEKLQAEKDVITLEEQANKISILEAENAQMQYAMMMGGLL